MDNNSKPKYIVPANQERSPEYNLGMMDALMWFNHQIDGRGLSHDEALELGHLIRCMISECKLQRLKEFETWVVPARMKNEEIKALVDGIEVEEVHIKN